MVSASGIVKVGNVQNSSVWMRISSQHLSFCAARKLEQMLYIDNLIQLPGAAVLVHFLASRTYVCVYNCLCPEASTSLELSQNISLSSGSYHLGYRSASLTGGRVLGQESDAGEAEHEHLDEAEVLRNQATRGLLHRAQQRRLVQTRSEQIPRDRLVLLANEGADMSQVSLEVIQPSTLLGEMRGRESWPSVWIGRCDSYSLF